MQVTFDTFMHLCSVDGATRSCVTNQNQYRVPNVKRYIHGGRVPNARHKQKIFKRDIKYCYKNLWAFFLVTILFQ